MTNTAKQPRKPLSELEHLVMDYVWSHSPATAEQVREALEAKHPMKDATVRTILRRIEHKSYISHRVEGRTYVYSGVERRDNVAVRAVRQVIDRFCGGSVEQLLVGMVNNEVLDRRELKKIAEKIAQRSRG